MKKKVTLFLSSMFVLFSFLSSASASPIFVNGKHIQFEVSPVIQNSRVLAPFRPIADGIGCTTKWDPESKTAIFKKSNMEIRLTVNSNIAIVTIDGVEAYKELDVDTIIESERIMIPVRFLSEEFGWVVDFDPETKAVYIETKDYSFTNDTNVYDYDDTDDVDYTENSDEDYVEETYDDSEVTTESVEVSTSYTRGKKNKDYEKTLTSYEVDYDYTEDEYYVEDEVADEENDDSIDSFSIDDETTDDDDENEDNRIDPFSIDDDTTDDDTTDDDDENEDNKIVPFSDDDAEDEVVYTIYKLPGATADKPTDGIAALGVICSSDEQFSKIVEKYKDTYGKEIYKYNVTPNDKGNYTVLVREKFHNNEFYTIVDGIIDESDMPVLYEFTISNYYSWLLSVHVDDAVAIYGLDTNENIFGLNTSHSENSDENNENTEEAGENEEE